ncbi:glutathione hydrolase 1 proenzyme-like [Clarias gariepinus]
MDKKIPIACFVFVFIIVVFLIVYFLLPPDDDCFPKAAVASDVGKCSEIGRDILKQKGSAVDAAIAALLCVGLYNPQSMGIGGGHFFLIYDSSTGKVETINAKETAPGGATRDMFPTEDLSQKGGLSIGVPGELRGYELAHRRHGRLPWRDLFEPSIKLARKGIPISEVLSNALNKSSEQGHILPDSALCEVFCNSNKTILRENDTIRFPRLADTYEKIANEGADVFYNGSMAQTIVDDIRAAGGIITLEDLSGYTPELNEDTIKINVGEYTMHFPNAPSSGPVLALILNILDGYNFSSSSLSSEETLTYHRIIEAFRFAFAKRTMLGDPRFLNITDFIHNMTSKYFANIIRSKISDETTYPGWYYEPEYSNPESYGTSHLSILAADGSAVAVTSTINLPFGSKVMSPSTGIIFNNVMDDFSSPNFPNAYDIPSSPNNFIQAGKRPLSAMCPTIIFDKPNKVKMVVGAEGGPKIITTTALVILNSLFFDKNVKKSVNKTRVHNQLNPNTTEVEDGFNQSVIEGLKKKNHNTTIYNDTKPFSVVQAVMRWKNWICAESDQRKGGKPAGY